MRSIGQYCVLVAFVGTGYACIATVLGYASRQRTLCRTGLVAGWASLAALSMVVTALIWGLLYKDFEFAYVAQYSSRQLAWYYSLSSLWVGQAGSLLLWTWFCAVLALVFRTTRQHDPYALREPAFGVLMGFCCFLTAVMAFAADPMTRSLAPPLEGVGLSPVLQHPSMLIHPPIVFLGYSLWAIPFALAVTALATGRLEDWTRQARTWALLAWGVLGCGILFGAQWAYDELGWGGYWSWDPVENGSLIPWLLGTTAIHASMASRRGMLKKSACGLTIAAFGMCTFSTFLTRSGIFSSLHAFSQSSIGWLFLALMVAIGLYAVTMIYWRRSRLVPDQTLRTVWCREAMVIVSAVALVTLTAVIFIGTLSTAISDAVIGRKIVVGPAFYNHALIPLGFVVLLATAVAPLLRWGVGPEPSQKRALTVSVVSAVVVSLVTLGWGVEHPIGLVVAGLSALAVMAFVSSVYLDARKVGPGIWLGLRRGIVGQRRKYAGFMIHMGLFCLAVGIAGSSLGSQRRELVMHPGETIVWLGRTVQFTRLVQRELADKLVVESQLEVSDANGHRVTLSPAQHYHILQDEWTTEVSVESSWNADFYTILLGSEDDDGVRLALVYNPLICFLWCGGWVMASGVIAAAWPSRLLDARTSAGGLKKAPPCRVTVARAAAVLLFISALSTRDNQILLPDNVAPCSRPQLLVASGGSIT